REQLESLGHRFRGHSDTEVVLASFEQWGLEDSIKRFVGMFSMAVWDRKHRELHLVRDRLGEKPLYYGWAGNVFVFSSELKALRPHPMWRGGVYWEEVRLLDGDTYIPFPHPRY